MRDSIHIVMVTGDFYPDSTGGVQRVVYYLSRGLVRRGHRVTVITRRVAERMPVVDEIDGISVVRFSSMTGDALRLHTSEPAASRRALRRVLARDPVDLVHVHEPLPGLGAAWALTGTNLPSVYTFHGQWSIQWLDARTHGSRGGGPVARSFAAYLRVIERLAMRRARRLVALSRFMADTAVQLYGIPRRKLRIVPNGVDLAAFRLGDQEAARRGIGLPVDRRVVGFAGRLSGEKGVSILLEAHGLLRGGKSRPLLAIAGTGPERPALERLVDRLGTRDDVRFLGYVEDMASFYRALDLLAVPSIREPFGLITLESLACGTPVIGGPTGGTGELLRSFDERLVLRDISPRAMADKIEEFAMGQRSQMSSGCRRFVEARFSWDRTVDGYERVYVECAAS